MVWKDPRETTTDIRKWKRGRCSRKSKWAARHVEGLDLYVDIAIWTLKYQYLNMGRNGSGTVQPLQMFAGKVFSWIEICDFLWLQNSYNAVPKFCARDDSGNSLRQKNDILPVRLNTEKTSDSMKKAYNAKASGREFQTGNLMANSQCRRGWSPHSRSYGRMRMMRTKDLV